MADTTAPRTVLFVDFRHIRCGDLDWRAADGSRLPLIRPPEPQVEAHAHRGVVPYGIRLVAQPARKTQPLPSGTRIGGVIREDGTYRTWYLKTAHRPGRDFGAYSTDVPENVAVHCAESSDGVEWRETARSEIEAPDQTGFDGFTCFADPSGPPEERYKAVYTARPPESQAAALWRQLEGVHPRRRDTRMRPDYLYGMYGAVSADGLRWRALGQPLMAHMSDTDTTVYYDAWLGRYVMYTRLYWQERRWVGRAETDDFRHWEGVEPLLSPPLDDPATDIYTNARTLYPEGPGYHLMFPMFYHRFDQTSDVRLYSSADGVHWQAVPGGPVLTPGDPGEWDGEFIHAGKALVPLDAERVGMPYHGTSYPHKHPRWPDVLAAGRTAWAWWPRGRLCAVTADAIGEFHTFALVPAGRELRLNARTRRAGDIRVGIVGRAGRSADDCDPIHGDRLSHPVHWKGESDIRGADGEPVALHFRMRAAELFALEWV
jgi:hypothetical protein